MSVLDAEFHALSNGDTFESFIDEQIAEKTFDLKQKLRERNLWISKHFSCLLGDSVTMHFFHDDLKNVSLIA